MKEAALACAAALTLGIGCAPPAGATPVVVMTIAPPPASASRRAPSAPEPRASPPVTARPTDAAPDALAGVWRDEETNHHFTIEVQAGRASVVAAVDEDDGERYEIHDVHFEKGALTWSYRVPSTGMEMSFATVSVDGDTLHCTWKNSAGSSGSEILIRVP